MTIEWIRWSESNNFSVELRTKRNTTNSPTFLKLSLFSHMASLQYLHFPETLNKYIREMAWNGSKPIQDENQEISRFSPAAKRLCTRRPRCFAPGSPVLQGQMDMTKRTGWWPLNLEASHLWEPLEPVLEKKNKDTHTHSVPQIIWFVWLF